MEVKHLVLPNLFLHVTMLHFFLFLFALLVACQKDESENGLDYLPSSKNAALYANNNIVFLSELLNEYDQRGILTAITTLHSAEGIQQITAVFSNGHEATFTCFSKNTKILLPTVDIKYSDSTYYWTITTADTIIETPMSGVHKHPCYHYKDGRWLVSLDGSDWIVIDSSGLSSYSHVVETSRDKDFVTALLGDEKKDIVVPTANVYQTLKQGVPNRSFYKDIILDAGFKLTTKSSMPAATAAHFTLENISIEEIIDTAWQNTTIRGTEADKNGRLLYPDGQARYKVLFVNGGNSNLHSESLGEECRQRMRDFVKGGGSYIGVCGGTNFASTGNVVAPDNPNYLGIYPGMLVSNGHYNTKTRYTPEPNNPLLLYDSTMTIKRGGKVKMNGGSTPHEYPAGTEILFRHDSPEYPNIDGKPSIWAYKSNSYSGKVILVSSHPEYATDDFCLALTKCMYLYAFDNVGDVRIKGLLRNGEDRIMDKRTADNMPDYTRLGDLQCHHFAVYIPDGATSIKFELSSASDCNLQLCVDPDSYAFADNARYTSKTIGSSQSLSFKSLPEGLYYIAVQSHSTVTATDITFGQEYSGRTDLLNGVPYSIKVSWQR